MRAHVVRYHRACHIMGVSVFVDSPGCQCVVNIRKCHYSCGKRNLVADQAVGISAAIEFFVMSQCNISRHFQKWRIGKFFHCRFECFRAVQCVRFHDLELAIGETSRFKEDTIRDRNLADIMERARVINQVDEFVIDFFSMFRVRLKLLSEEAAIASNAVEMRSGFRIARLGQLPIAKIAISRVSRPMIRRPILTRRMSSAGLNGLMT